MNSVTPELLAQLIDAHADALELFAAQWSHAPADVVQEAFVELARQPTLPGNVPAWLYHVVRNRAISEARPATRRRRREAAFSRCRTWFRMAKDGDVDSLDAAEALRKLPEELREVVVARIWGGFTLEQIAEITGTSAASAFRRYAEAIALLRTDLGILCQNMNTSPRK